LFSVERYSFHSPSAGRRRGSHGHLANEFITSILEYRRPLADIYEALAMTVPGIAAHQSALGDGETLEIPQYERPTPRP